MMPMEGRISIPSYLVIYSIIDINNFILHAVDASDITGAIKICRIELSCICQ